MRDIIPRFSSFCSRGSEWLSASVADRRVILTLSFVAGLHPALLFFCSVPRGIPRAICLRLLARHCMSVPVLALSCVRRLRRRIYRPSVSCAHEYLSRYARTILSASEDYVPDQERKLRYSPS